jgi:hypothetical protein
MPDTEPAAIIPWHHRNNCQGVGGILQHVKRWGHGGNLVRRSAIAKLKVFWQIV